MERFRPESPIYARQKSISNSSVTSGSGAPSSPTMSPIHRHIRTGSAGGAAAFRRQQNSAARAAAQRLARVMAHQPAGDGGSSDEDDEEVPVAVVEHSTPRRSQRSPSPGLGRYLAEQTSTVRSTSSGRPAVSARTTTPTLIPPIKPLSRPVSSTLALELPVSCRRDKRMSIDLGNLRETVHHSSTALQDEIDVLEEKNENIVGKLQVAEEKCDEAEARAKQFEKQVAPYGESASLDARQLGRKEAVLQQREAALKAAGQNSRAMNEEISALRLAAKNAKKEAASTAEHLQEAESELKSLRAIAQRMVLNQEEMEEVALKRCWLARYWKLCVHHGIHADIAESKCEYWSSFALFPLEVVLSAGQKARDEGSTADGEEDKMPWDVNDIAGEGNIESLLLVEQGLRELVSLKVEEAVLLAMAQHRRANTRQSQCSSGSLLPTEGQNQPESFELSQEETEDVLFKQAWLTYFWGRVKNHGLEEDIADERLQFWINQGTHSPTMHDAVDVERGLFELKKLGLEFQLWKATREGFDPDSGHHGMQSESEL